MTVADTIHDTIADNWGNGGYAGAAPTITTSETARQPDHIHNDVIEVRHYTLDEDHKQVNNKYADKFYTLVVRVTSKTSAAQLKLIADEAEWLLRNTTMTGVQIHKIRKDYSATDRERIVHGLDMYVTVVDYLADGATVPAAGSNIDWVLDTLEFTGGGGKINAFHDDDTMASDDADGLASQQSIKAYADAAIDTDIATHAAIAAAHHTKYTDAEALAEIEGQAALEVGNVRPKTDANLQLGSTTKHWSRVYLDDNGQLVFGDSNDVSLFRGGANKLETNDDLECADLECDSLTITGGGTLTATPTQIEDLLMFGSANAGYVNLNLWGLSEPTKGIMTADYLTNVDATNFTGTWELSGPYIKGGLKMYCTEIVVGLRDADAGDFLSGFYFTGYTDFETSAAIDTVADNIQPGEEKTYDDFAPADLSSYKSVKVRLYFECTNAADLKISYVRAKVYYAA